MIDDPIEAEVQAKAGHLTIRQQNILRQALIREYKQNGMEDFIRGYDDGEAWSGKREE